MNVKVKGTRKREKKNNNNNNDKRDFDNMSGGMWVRQYVCVCFVHIQFYRFFRLSIRLLNKFIEFYKRTFVEVKRIFTVDPVVVVWECGSNWWNKFDGKKLVHGGFEAEGERSAHDSTMCLCMIGAIPFDNNTQPGADTKSQDCSTIVQ